MNQREIAGAKIENLCNPNTIVLTQCLWSIEAVIISELLVIGPPAAVDSNLL